MNDKEESNTRIENKPGRRKTVTFKTLLFGLPLAILAAVAIYLAMVNYYATSFRYAVSQPSLRVGKAIEPLDCAEYCSVDPYFVAAIKYLQKSTNVPLLLPLELPDDLTSTSLEVNILEPLPNPGHSADEYRIQLLADPPDCNWPSDENCYIGDLEAQEGEPLPIGNPVNLVQGIKGVYEEGVLDGGTCDPEFSCGTLAWIEDNVLYTYSFGFSYPEGTIIDMANSAILAGGRWVCSGQAPPDLCVAQ
jgi:hypothetical protein